MFSATQTSRRSNGRERSIMGSVKRSDKGKSDIGDFYRGVANIPYSPEHSSPSHTHHSHSPTRNFRPKTQDINNLILSTKFEQVSKNKRSNNTQCKTKYQSPRIQDSPTRKRAGKSILSDEDKHEVTKRQMLQANMRSNTISGTLRTSIMCPDDKLGKTRTRVVRDSVVIPADRVHNFDN